MCRSAWLSDDGAKSLLVLMNNDTKKYYWMLVYRPLKEFEDTKGVIRIRKLKKYRQRNDEKGQAMIYKHTHITKDGVTWPP